MNTTLLFIRKRQIIYELKQLGVYSVILFVLSAVLIYYTYILYQDPNYSVLITISLAASCFTFQSVRKDKSFLYLQIPDHHKSLYLEYAVFIFPLTVMCLFTPQWYCFFILQGILAVIPFSKFTIRQRTLFRNISKVIPPSDFEWISGFRRSYAQIIPVYLLALGLSWIKIIPLFLLWYLTLVISSFYNECESVRILREGNVSSVSFIKKKIISQSTLLIIFYLPVLIINTVFNFNFLLLNIGLMLSQLALLIFVICFKYSNYRPDQIQYGNNLFVILVSLCASIPVLLPVPGLVAVKYYSNAKHNLKEYFND